MKRFLIVCTCGNVFWRSNVCGQHKNGMTKLYDCPKGRRNKAEHKTRCSSLGQQMLYVHNGTVPSYFDKRA